jgi:hypothetical protein
VTQQKTIEKLLHARRMQDRAARRLKLAMTTWEKWSKRVSYYSKQLGRAG